MNKAVAVMIGVVLGLAGAALAQEPPPGFGAVAQYRFGTGARALGLGGAFTATAEGPEGLYWNPAGLVGSALSAGGMYTEPFSGVGGGALDYRVQYLGVVGTWRGLGLGGGWFNVHVGGIPYTDEGGTFSYDSSVFLGGLAVQRELADVGKVAVGFTAKLYREQMLQGRAQGVGFDLGVIADFGLVRIGYCSQDVGGTRYRWQGTGQEPQMEVPWVHRIAVAGRWLDGALATSGEAVLEPPAAPTLRLGIEWVPLEILALRVGVRLENFPGAGYRPVWSAGVGVSWGMLLLDAAYLRNPIVGLSGGGDLPTDTFVFSVGIEF